MEKIRVWRFAGPLAAIVWLLVLVVFGARLPGYSQLLHPVSLLGATGVPHGVAFSLLGFVLPGLLAVVVAVQLLRQMPDNAGRSMRIAGQLLLLAALAFAAMGLLPLDAEDIESRASQYHASLWMVWLVAFVVGGGGLAVLGFKRTDGWRLLAVVAAACSVWVFAAAFLFEILMPVALAQRLAFAGWMLWLLVSPQLQVSQTRSAHGAANV